MVQEFSCDIIDLEFLNIFQRLNNTQQKSIKMYDEITLKKMFCDQLLVVHKLATHYNTTSEASAQIANQNLKKK